ncbi:MAG TPA: endonuclease/exonuclease/phosphatase family protein [Gaiellaceae bacterium]|nr:endonuclease/exonuclease/phosphatase family protein [Gaiellaceae bacterium]
MPLLVRTWNVFHGNAVPPERDAFLEEMVALAAADDPDVLCLQEVPLWALPFLGGWSGMTAVGAVAARPRIGPVPSSAALGRALTDLNHGLLRSAFTGQANAVLVGPRLRVLEEWTLVLNPFRFRREQARWLGLDLVTELAWAKERRVCVAVRAALPDGGGTALAASLHTTSLASEERVPDAELRRAAAFLDGLAAPDEPVFLCGDTNVSASRSRTMADLREWGYSEPGPHIDHVLVRGLPATPPFVWPEERRRVDGRVVSDHAPVEVTAG